MKLSNGDLFVILFKQVISVSSNNFVGFFFFKLIPDKPLLSRRWIRKLKLKK